MSSDHTPGPWKATWNAYRERWIVAGGDTVEEANYATGMSMDQTVVGPDGLGASSGANARLISKAPEMYAELKRQGHRKAPVTANPFCSECGKDWPCAAARIIADVEGRRG